MLYQGRVPPLDDVPPRQEDLLRLQSHLRLEHERRRQVVLLFRISSSLTGNRSFGAREKKELFRNVMLLGRWPSFTRVRTSFNLLSRGKTRSSSLSTPSGSQFLTRSEFQSLSLSAAGSGFWVPSLPSTV